MSASPWSPDGHGPFRTAPSPGQDRQHLLHHIPAEDAQCFYEASTQQEVETLGDDPRRISVDGHNLPRHTKIVVVTKGKIGSTGRVLPGQDRQG